MQGQCGGCCLRTAIFLTNKYSITMKKYKGTKVVSAEPMNEYDAVQKGIARPNTDNHEWREGYHVVYLDGYHSWSPKNVFEEAYKCSETYTDRAKIEKAELQERMTRLDKFIHSENFNNLDDEEQSLLLGQFGAMMSYFHILKSRIAKAEN